MSEKSDAINDEERKEMVTQMNEWVVGWKDDGWMDGWIDKWMGGWINGLMDRWVDWQMNE